MNKAAVSPIPKSTPTDEHRRVAPDAPRAKVIPLVRPALRQSDSSKQAIQRRLENARIIMDDYMQRAWNANKIVCDLQRELKLHADQ